MPPRDRTKRRVVPSQERALASVVAILSATEEMLREHGFSAMTTNQIAERAGVNVALLYRYFAGKEALVGALIERVASRTYEAVEAAIQGSDQAPLSEALAALLEALIDTPGVHPTLHRELLEHVDVSKRRAVVHDVRERLADLFRAFLRQRKSELRPVADLEALVFVLQHGIDAAAHAAAFYRPESLSRERAFAALRDLVERALLPVHDARPS